jgi:NAD(P)-dependent dehydrogenase (short-subunit alcohol dehydrogenase family)
VANAAIRPRGDILHADLEQWRRTIDVNLTGVFLLAKAVLPTMVAAGRGAIVNVGSASGWGRPGLAAYSAAKAGVLGLSQAMAYDLAPHGVRVNTVVPGGVLTGMIEDTVPVGRQPAPERYPVAPTDVGDAVAYLLSERAARVTGAVLNVGGFFLQGGTSGPTTIGPP